MGVALVLLTLREATKFGLGRHRKDIPDAEWDTYVKLNLVVSCSYICGFVLAKMSFAYLYLKVLPERKYQRLNKFMLCFLTAQWIEEICVVLFECKPINKLWSPFIDGKCLDLTYFFYAVVCSRGSSPLRFAPCVSHKLIESFSLASSS